MAASRIPQIEEILRELELTTSQVEASAVVSVEGLPICSAMPLGVDDGILAAMTATILSVAERAAGELARGKLNRVLVEGEDGYFIISSAGREAILAVLTKSKANLGMVFLAMDRACEQISKLI
ncbi:MAG: roadblock/LC7 domain-containing protein [Candidatus Odinarchaeum yellowstonii]|uniref:Roadblock/LC7 domain-containing protein n=1 Tax=Odinarchaeota yellowstonii (strain LCB_4) TaxID=1841599 RepID=A0AAF0IAB7_ODILC|nr:MAG: roadblock/LC7 domain-containing protein [Candidatus Odinarchaeum yellowstonii]